MTEKQYDALVKEMSPPSPLGKDCLIAFLVGGAICCLGQVFTAAWALTRIWRGRPRP